MSRLCGPLALVLGSRFARGVSSTGSRGRLATRRPSWSLLVEVGVLWHRRRVRENWEIGLGMHPGLVVDDQVHEIRERRFAAAKLVKDTVAQLAGGDPLHPIVRDEIGTGDDLVNRDRAVSDGVALIADRLQGARALQLTREIAERVKATISRGELAGNHVVDFLEPASLAMLEPEAEEVDLTAPGFEVDMCDSGDLVKQVGCRSQRQQAKPGRCTPPAVGERVSERGVFVDGGDSRVCQAR